MTITIRVTKEQHDRLMRPLGNCQRGGFQRLIERLQLGLKWRSAEEWDLTMTRDDGDRVLHYADDFGEGTYQSVLRSIRDDVRAALAQLPPPVVTGSLFADAFDA